MAFLGSVYICQPPNTASPINPKELNFFSLSQHFVPIIIFWIIYMLIGKHQSVLYMCPLEERGPFKNCKTSIHGVVTNSWLCDCVDLIDCGSNRLEILCSSHVVLAWSIFLVFLLFSWATILHGAPNWVLLLAEFLWQLLVLPIMVRFKCKRDFVNRCLYTP